MYNDDELQRIRVELDNLIGSMVYQEHLQQELPENIEFEMENPNEEEYYDEDEFFNWKGIDDDEYYNSGCEEEFNETERPWPRCVTPGRVSDAINTSMFSFWHQVFNALLKNNIMPTQLIPPEVLISNNFMLCPSYTPQDQINTCDSSTTSNLSTNPNETTSEENFTSNDDKKSDDKKSKHTILPFKYSCVARDYYKKL